MDKDNSITVAARKNDPNYAQFSVYLPKQLVKELKVIAAQEEMTQTDIAEEALTQWVKNKRSGKNNQAGSPPVERPDTVEK